MDTARRWLDQTVSSSEIARLQAAGRRASGTEEPVAEVIPPAVAAAMPFVFEGAEMRVVVRDGAPWFVGKDVAERLGYANETDAMKRHCKGVVKRYPLLTAGGTQEIRVLSEPDMLRLIVGSNLPAAQRFERWVFEDVLPSIRKRGGYIAGQEKVATGEMSPAELMARALTAAHETIREAEEARRPLHRAPLRPWSIHPFRSGEAISREGAKETTSAEVPRKRRLIH